jgi:cytochrome c oxidase subunit II
VFLAIAGCHADHEQSALHPAGPAAREIAWLWWYLFGILTAVFAGTMLLLLLALVLPRRDKAGPPGGDVKFVVVAGIVVPAAILVALLILSLRSTIALRLPETNLTINVIGHQWWWEVEYPQHGVISANEVYIPVGEPVRLKLTSADVIHSLWVPNLTSKMDLLPRRMNTFWIQADHAGTWRGQCAEYCGLQHARMALRVVALEREDFDAWIAERQRPVREPDTDLLRRGRDVYFSEPAACYACHAIRGTEAQANHGPDLTHIASRLTLGAGQIANTRDLLARWIVDSHEFKPGNRMPPTEIEPDELDALVEYLMTLE